LHDAISITALNSGQIAIVQDGFWIEQSRIE
jgi:hypothetical protein